jgi:hypothetical protein
MSKQVLVALIENRKEDSQTTPSLNVQAVLMCRLLIWTLIAMEEHYTGCQQSTTFVLNVSTQFSIAVQYTCDVIVAPCCVNSQHQRLIPVPENSFL